MEIDPQLLERIGVAVHESLMQMIRVTCRVGFEPSSAISMVREHLDKIEMMVKETGHVETADVRVFATDRGRARLKAEDLKARLARSPEAEAGSSDGIPVAEGEPGSRRGNEDTECCGIDPSPRRTGFSKPF